MKLMIRYFIRYFISYLKWLLAGKPMKKYSGFSCGCCGKWWNIPFKIPVYQSCGEWGDTWGLCPKDKGCRVIEKNKKKIRNKNLQVQGKV